MNKKLRTILIIVVSFAVLGMCIVSFGLYPILIVSGSPVYAFEYRDAYDLSYAYYSYLAQGGQTAEQDKNMQLQLDRAVLEGLVDAHLIEKRLVLDVGAREFRGEIAAIVDPLWSDSASRETLRAMTQASDGSIKKYFLEHEARHQILSSRLQADGLSLEEWLREARKDASVIFLFMPDVEWTSEGVVSK